MRRFLIGVFLGLFCVLAGDCVFPKSVAAQSIAVTLGFKPLQYISEGNTLPLLVFYPARSPEKEHTFGRMKVLLAEEGLPLSQEPRPLVVISHGSGGHELSHLSLVRFLVQRGYIVATFRHLSDNIEDKRGSSTLEVWARRPREWTKVLDQLLLSPIASFIDQKRIVALGFSAGAYTALVVGGARPSIQALKQYCTEHAPKDVMCFSFGMLSTVSANISRWFGYQDAEIPAKKDPRVCAVVALAPIGSALFTPASFPDDTAPILLMKGQEDAILKFPNDARYLKDILGKRAQYHEVSGGHYVFLSIGVISEKEKEILNEINQEVGGFLNRTLQERCS